MPTKPTPYAEKAENVYSRCYIEGDASIYDAVTLVGARTVAPASTGDAVFGVLIQNPPSGDALSSLSRVVTSGVTAANVSASVDADGDAPRRLVAGEHGELRLLGDGETAPVGGATIRAFDAGPRGASEVYIR